MSNSTAGKENFLKRFRDNNARKMKEFTAAQFAEVWKHYDADGNGFIEGSELDNFLEEFVTSVFLDEIGDEVIPKDDLELMKKEFMATFDENADDRIEISEMAKILPTEENFLLLFHRDIPLESSVEFMQIWKRFDKDHSGFIEADELKDFLRDLLKKAKPDETLDETKLNEYTSSVLDMFDQNKDGKLQLSEMARLVPVKENYLCRPILKDGNQTIENEELMGFLKDLLDLVHEEYNEKDLEFFKHIILSQWDIDNDGKINREELKMMFLQQSRLLTALRQSD